MDSVHTCRGFAWGGCLLEATVQDECLSTDRARPTDDGTNAVPESLPLDAASIEKCGTDPVANIRWHGENLGSSVENSDY